MITLILILITCLIFFLTSFRSKQNLWNSYFNSSNETICFISNHYIVSKKADQRSLFTYISGVNDELDLSKYQDQISRSDYKPVTFSYLTKMAPIAIHSLTRHFLKNDADFAIELESDFKYDDLNNKNLIFIGQFSCLHQSKTLFLDKSKVFENKTGSFIFHTKNDTIKYFNKGNSDNTRDYAMVSYRKMDNGNSVLFFSSNHDIGVIATVRNFTDPKWLKNFYAQFPKDAESFNALFKVTGYERTELECKLEKIEFLK